MYGVGPTGSGAQALRSHIQGAAGNPLLLADRVNVVMDSGDDLSVLIILIILFTIKFWMCDRASTTYHPVTCTANSTSKCIFII